MTLNHILQPYIDFSDKWLTKFVLLWNSISLLYGLKYIDDTALAIAAPMMTLIMYFSGLVIVKVVIEFQQVNPFNAAKSNFLKYAILACWAFGFIGFIHFLIGGIFPPEEFENFNYFVIVASVFPLAFSSGAAKQWKKISPPE